MGKLTIQDIAKVLTDRKGLSKKEASNFAGEMFDIIKQALERDLIVKVKGLGTFKIIDVDPRESVNVNTGERVLIEGHSKITFTPDQLLKEIVNKPFSQFETVVLNDGVDFSEEASSGAYATPELANTMPLVDFVVSDPSFEHPVPLGESVAKEAPVAEAVEESVPIAEPAPAVEPKAPETESVSAPESAPVTEDALAPEPEETPVDENSDALEPDVADKPDVADEPDEEEVYADEESSSGGWKWLIPTVTLLLGLGIGYLLGNYFPMQGKQPVEAPKPPVEQPKVVVEDTVVVDSTVSTAAAPAEGKAEAVKPEEVKPVTSKPVESKPAPKINETAPAAAKPEAPAAEPDKYAAMDARVRTGAYRIVGTDKVVKVKEGDNVRKIAQRTLGPDMECYLEVYNGLKISSPLKVGQEIKIPKLQLKKKKKAQSAN